MRLRIKFTAKEGELTLPVHHNEILQAIIYKHLESQLAKRLHEKGIKDPESERSLKLFTFSRLLAKKVDIDPDKRFITFSSPITWVVASPLHEFIVSLYNNLIKNREVELLSYNGKTIVCVSNIWFDPVPAYKCPVLIETLSPITSYRTEMSDSKAFTHYYSPKDPEFNDLIIGNLLRKYRTLTGNALSIDEKAYVKPVRIANRENILYFKDTLIKGWSGIFELSLPKELFYVAFSCGLGAKNSQGFGCIGIWRGGP